VAATFVLIPGAGGSAWYWHRVTPLLAEAGVDAIAVELPAADDSADLTTYADVACAAIADVDGPLILVGQSMGAFTAPMVADRIRVARIVLVNPMVPTPGESPGQWWDATGQDQAMAEHFRRIGLPDKGFDPVEGASEATGDERYFFHDVPAHVRDEAFSQPAPRQSDTPFGQTWPLHRWPDVLTQVVAGSDDRFFPLEFQRRLVRERLGLDVDVLPGGHLMALSRPRELADYLLALRSGR
jgi:pimeloyl-ACP methyl ester carboxylesterase